MCHVLFYTVKENMKTRTLRVRYEDGRKHKCHFCSEVIDLSNYTVVVRRMIGRNNQSHGHTIKWKRVGYACSKCEESRECNIL